MPEYITSLSNSIMVSATVYIIQYRHLPLNWDCLSYLSVLSVCSQELRPGEIMAIMQVLLLSPMKESRSTWVSFEARNGRWAPRLPSARMHSFNASNDLLISALSMPGRSNNRKLMKVFSDNCKTALLLRSYVQLVAYNKYIFNYRNKTKIKQWSMLLPRVNYFPVIDCEHDTLKKNMGYSKDNRNIKEKIMEPYLQSKLNSTSKNKKIALATKSRMKVYGNSRKVAKHQSSKSIAPEEKNN